VSREGFFMSGRTAATLNVVGKMPLEKDKLASLVISSAKTDGHNFKSVVGMKSTEEDLEDIVTICFLTSSTVTHGIESKGKPE